MTASNDWEGLPGIAQMRRLFERTVNAAADQAAAVGALAGNQWSAAPPTGNRIVSGPGGG